MKKFHRYVYAVCLVALGALSLHAQSDRGTLTGTITDPAAAVVPGAKITIRNTETGAAAETVSTPTGNYTLASLTPGMYELIVEASGFKKTTQTGIQIQVATTARLDVALQVGTTSDSVTVTAEATLLKTESGEMSNNVSGDRINSLPINFGGGGGSGGNVRSWTQFASLSPGVTGNGQANRVNGSQAAQYKIIIEGQDISSSNDINYTSTAVQSSVEQIEEFTLQTSNYAPEFGQVAGGLFNFSIKSGTNNFHGSLYEYFANEALDAARPFVAIRPFSRKHDFGGLLTGPVWIPKIYNGRNRTFFSFNNESFRNRIQPNASFQTLPSEAYRNGDFSEALRVRPGFVRGQDNQNRDVIDGVIYDPATNTTVNGLVYRTPFPGNIIPRSRFDPVSVKIQALIPKTNIGGPNTLLNNWIPSYTNDYTQNLPGVKIDQTITGNQKASFYISQLVTNKLVSPDGLPGEMSAIRVSRTSGLTLRANYDYVISPTMVLHLGAGYLRFHNPDTSPDESLLYDAVGGLGFRGSTTTPSGFPRITGISNGNYGGMLNMGPTNANKYYDNKWTSVASLSYVRDNHTYKIGAEYQLNSWTDRNTRQAQGVLNFNASETGPSTATNGKTLQTGQNGLGYASFLLGAVNNASVNAPQDPQIRSYKGAMFIQDDWKATRKLTINYGLRWDILTEGNEIHYRSSMFGPTIANPNAGNRLGGIVYEGYGNGRCNCKFAKPYPYAIGPRLSAAYQMGSKTVIRAGIGVIYGNLPTIGYSTNGQIQGVGIGSAVFPDPANGQPALYLQDGLQYNPADLYRVSLDPGLLVTPGGALNGGPAATTDANAARPPRILQYNVSVQREITRDVVIEAAYVGNRSAWLIQNGLVSPNALTRDRLKTLGLDPYNNAADRALLTGTMTSAAAIARGFSNLPYAGFRTANTVAQSLRPFPQFNGALTPRWAPLGNSWYDSLQVKVTKRYGHGLDGSMAFTWNKELSTYAQSDLANRALNKGLTAGGVPLNLVIGLNYETPKVGNKFVRHFVGGWTLGTLLQYQSGTLISAPTSNTVINSYTFAGGTRKNRVPGVPLFLKDLNCGCIDPTKDLVLNPAAWAEVPEGTYTPSSQYFNDYRNARRPAESISLGRRFMLSGVREGMSISVRAEFFNVFNRLQLATPTSGDSGTARAVNSATGNLSGGFGFIDAFGNPGTPNALPRNGQLVARLQF